MAERVLGVVAEVELNGLIDAQLYEVVLGADRALGFVHAHALHMHPQRLSQPVPVGDYDHVRAALEAVLDALLHQLLHVVVGYLGLILRQPLLPLLLSDLSHRCWVGGWVVLLRRARHQPRTGDVLDESDAEGVDALL